eukprot:gene31982-42675_t
MKVQQSPRIEKKQPYGSSAESSTFAQLLKNHHVSKIAGVHVRNISESTITARTVARKTLYRFTKVPTSSDSKGVIDDAFDIHVRRNRRVDNGFHLTDATFSKSSLEAHLVMAINRKRQLLSGTALDLFDAQWGILSHTDSIL